MKPLKIALVCKNENSTKRDDRSMGYFSYAVDDLFTWEHITPGKNFTISLKKLKEQGFDLVFHEDYPYGYFEYTGAIPVIFLSIDSTLSDEHYKARFEQARRADLVLVDHDNVNRFFNINHKTIQFPYCVNDKIFYRDDRERTNDIAYHCSSSAHAGIEERKRIRTLLHDLSQKHHWSYKSGILDIKNYADSFRSSKIVVNQTRTPANRPHRIFDAMACGAMVLTSNMVTPHEDKTMWGANISRFNNDTELEEKLNHYLENEHYRNQVATEGYNMVIQNHTWSIRAKQLREIINKEFGL